MLAAGMRALEADEIDLAIEAFDEVVAQAPHFAEGYNQRATAYFLAHDFDASLADIDRVLALEPRHFGALTARGLIHLARGNDYLALIAFEAVLAIHPSAPDARRYVGILRHRLGEETV
jgi:tetratricopeptide (TPR) repeat protein